jgi:hypothetical protein
MGVFSDRIQKQAAVRTIAVRSDDEELQKAIEDRSEAMSLAFAVAGDVDEPLAKAIANDPEWYLEGAGVDVAADLGDAEVETLLPDRGGEDFLEKAYTGFAKGVAKLMSEGKSRKEAEGIMADAGRAKYGSRFDHAAASGTKLG